VLAPQGRQLTEEATMDEERDSERFETVIIGGGQAGLAVGRQLIRLGLSSVILDAGDRVGDVWRTRWDSLRLFTPARYDGLPGLPFPAPRYSFPTKDEMADYLEAYADHFQLPVRNGVTVAGLRREGDRHMLRVGGRWLEADRVVVATGACHSPHIPAFAGQLDPGIVQLHSQDYRRPSQLRGGGVLVVGAGNSGAEIALEAAKEHRTWLAGRHPGHLPVRHGPAAARFVFPVVRLLGSRVLTLDTPIGRKVRPKFVSRGAPLIRVRPNEYATAGIERVPRVTGVRDGWSLLADGRVLEVANVVWCTGFGLDLSWIDLPVFTDEGEPRHWRGVVDGEPGLYFVGLQFQYAATSQVLPGVGRDAEYVARHIAEHAAAGRPGAHQTVGAAGP
jgi:putative flavoprotein involved in K+ transport